MNKRWNSIWLGLLLGLAWPLAVAIIFYFTKFSDYQVTDFIRNLFELKVFSKFISLCVYPNLLIFFIFIWRNLLYSARGVLMATIVLAIFVFIYKLSV